MTGNPLGALLDTQGNILTKDYSGAQGIIMSRRPPQAPRETPQSFAPFALPSLKCLDNNGKQLITIDNNGQQSAVLHASLISFFKTLLLPDFWVATT